MEKQKTPLKITAVRFVRAVRNFTSSEVGWKAKLMFAGLIALLFGINGMNVVNSYVGREFMTAIADRDKAEFLRQALFYHRCLRGFHRSWRSSPASPRNALALWREFLTRQAVTLYLADGTYYRLEAVRGTRQPGPADRGGHPLLHRHHALFCPHAAQQQFHGGRLFRRAMVNQPLAVRRGCALRGVRLSLTIVLGRPLVTLNYNQLDKEANFRSGLIHVRENAE